MELSTSMNVLFDPGRVTAEQAVERLDAAGFRVLDCNFVDWLFDGSPFVADDWGRWVEGIGRRAQALGLRFGQAHGPIFNKFEDSDKARRLTALSHRSIEAAGLLNASWVVFEPETLPGAFDRSHLERIRQRNLEWFGALLPTAERAGVGIAIENMTDGFAPARGCRRWPGSLPAELIDLVDGFGSPRVGICWDTGHAHLQRLDQAPAIRALGRRLKATHIQDNDAQSDEHLLPYYGGIDWPAVVAALRDGVYEGDFTYEAHNSIRVLPDELRDAALRFAVHLGRHLLGLPA